MLQQQQSVQQQYRTHRVPWRRWGGRTNRGGDREAEKTDPGPRRGQLANLSSPYINLDLDPHRQADRQAGRQASYEYECTLVVARETKGNKVPTCTEAAEIDVTEKHQTPHGPHPEAAHTVGSLPKRVLSTQQRHGG